MAKECVFFLIKEATMKDQMTSRHPPTALKRKARSPGGFQNCRPTEAKAKTIGYLSAEYLLGRQLGNALLATDLNEVAAALEAVLGESETTKLIWKPQAPTEISDLDTAQKLMKLIDALEEDDDVQTVTGNFDLTDDVAAQL